MKSGSLIPGFARLRLRRIFRDRSGASGIEFALVLPLMILLFAGTVEFGHALTVSRKIDQIASTTGDIISQQGTWTKSDIAKLLTGTSFILQPYDTSGLTIIVTAESMNGSGKTVVDWSAALNTSALVAGAASPIEVPAGIQETGVEIVLTRVQYQYTTPLSALFASLTGVDGYSFDSHCFNHPRVGDTITYR